MKYNLITLVLISFLFTTGINSQENTWFEEYYFGYSDEVTCVKSTPENDFIFTCKSDTINNFGAFYRRSITVKTNQYGEIQWKSVIGNPLTDTESYSFVVSEEDYSITTTGHYFEFGYGQNTAMMITKYDEQGELQWMKNYNHENSFVHMYGMCIQQHADGGYIIAGVYGDIMYEVEGDSLFLMKTDSHGDSIWMKTYDFGDDIYIKSLLIDKDGNYVVCGTIEYFDPEVLLVKADEEGDTLWTKTILLGDGASGNSIIETNDQLGYIIAGGIRGNGSIGYTDALMMKTAYDGELIWNKQYNGLNYSDGFKSIIAGNVEGYVAAGYAGSANSLEENSKRFVVSTFETGDTIWTSIAGNLNGYQGASSIDGTLDNGYIVGGKGDIGATLSKMDENGNGLTYVAENITSQSYPSFEIRQIDNSIVISGLIENDKSIISIDIFDLKGILIGSIVKPFDHHEVQVHCGNLNRGVYIINVQCGNSYEVKKVFLY